MHPMSATRITPIGRRLALGAALAAGPLALAAPATISWTGIGTTNFETPGNWTGGVTPANDLTSNIASFTGAAGMVQPALTQDRSIAGLYLYIPTTTTPVVLGGTGYTLSIGASGITQQAPSSGSSYTSTILANVNVTTSQNWSLRNKMSVNGVLSGSGAMALTAGGYLFLGGTSTNTYNGVLTLSGGNGRLYLSKTAGAKALSGDIVVDTTGGSVTWDADNQLANTSNITLKNGTLSIYKGSTGNNGSSETFNTLTMSGGAVNTDGGASGLTGTTDSLVTNQSTTVTGGALNVRGGTQWTMDSLAISNGGVVNRVGTSYGTSTASRALTVGAGGLAITNQASGSYAPIMIGNSLTGKATNKLVLLGDVTFNGYAGNANTAYISTDTVNPANPVKGTVELNGTRTFTVNDGDAAVDFRIDPAVNNNGAVAGSLVKAGLGTLELTGSNGYTGGSTVNAGTLRAGNANAFGSGTITLAGGTLDLTAYNVGNAINITGSNASILYATSSAAMTTSFAAGSKFRGWQRQSGVTGGNNTLAQLLGGTAGGSDATVTSSWSAGTNPAAIVSDVLDIKGINGTTFVLQMNYADSAFNDANAALGWYNPGSSTWVNAVLGNDNGSGTLGTHYLAAYDPTASYNLGDWGIDTTNNTVWAVVNHNSEFAVVVPEPAVLGLLGLGGLALLRRRRNG